jgi:hypothetical protein
MYFNYVIPALSCCSINKIDSQWEEMQTKSSVSRPATLAPSTTGLASGSAAAGESRIRTPPMRARPSATHAAADTARTQWLDGV